MLQPKSILSTITGGHVAQRQLAPRGKVRFKQIAVPIEATSAASANVGPFPTSADRFSVTTGAGGPDIAANTSFGFIFEVSSFVPATAEVIWSYASATTGWYAAFDGSSTNFSISVRNGAVTTVFAIPYKLGPGLHHGWLTRLPGGSAIHLSLDGDTAFQLTNAFTYTTNGAGAQNVIGGVNTALVASGLPCSTARVLGTAHINALLSDADLAAFSNQVNLTNRYGWPAAVTGHANAVSVWAATDWDGVSATTTAGHGSSPTTWTKSGTVVKNTVKAENEYTAQDWWIRDASSPFLQTYQTGSGHYRMRNAFARFAVSLSATPDRISPIVAADTQLLPAGFFPQTGLRIDGLPSGLSGDGLQANGAGLLRVTDWLSGSFQAGTTFEFIDGLNGRIVTHGIRRGTPIMGFRIPTDVSITAVSEPPLPSGVILMMGASLLLGSGLLAPNVSSWPMLMRTNRGNVKMWCSGTEEAWDICKDAGTITATMADLAGQMEGVTQIWFDYGTNDWGGGGAPPWASVANFQTQVGNLLDAIHAAYPAVQIFVQSPIHFIGEGPNASGQTLQQFRDALSAVAVARPTFTTFVDGTTFCPFTTGASAINMLQSDSHTTQVGHAYEERRAAHILGYTSPYPWMTPAIFADSVIKYAWVADAAFTGGGGTVTTWTPQKGGVNLLGVANPTWAANYGAENLGVATLNGTTQCFTGNAVSADVSGSSKPYTILLSTQPIVIAVKICASFDNSDATKGVHDWGMNTATNRITTTRQTDDPATSINLNTTQTIDTSRQVWQYGYDGTNATARIQGSDTSINGTAQNKQPITVTQFTVGAFHEGGGPSLFYNGKVRAVLMSPTVIPQTPLQISVGYMMSEAA